jgi:Holliday junction resolvase RusA-like endonuclease
VILVIEGLPSQKKNSPQIGYVGKKCPVCGRGQPRVFPDPKYRKWEKLAIPQLQAQWMGRPAVGGKKHPLRIDAVFYLGKRQHYDLSNLLAALGDVLEKAGVITSDYWIDSWGDSRRDRDWDRPRVEIILS